MNNKVYIVYVNGGYKIDNGYGKFLFDGKTFTNVREAEDFAIENQLDYVVV